MYMKKKNNNKILKLSFTDPMPFTNGFNTLSNNLILIIELKV